jgi:GT2 family glycosyltransferase
MPGFAVVAVNYGTPELTARCLEAARREEPDEVLVVDNASPDDSVQGLRAAGLEVLARPTNDGFAAGVNAGLAATSSAFVVVLNPDTEPRPGALRALVEHLERSPRVGVVAPRLLYPDGTPQPSAYRRFPGLGMLTLDLCLPLGFVAMALPALDPYRVPPKRWRDGLGVAHVSGAAFALRRSAYQAAGPLDEGFFLYLEETEWQQRVRGAGFDVEVLPSAEVVHAMRGGGEAALAPSPHFLVSARRYLRLRGVPAPLIRAAIDGSLLASRVAARAERLLPPERRTGGARARAYDELWRRR